MMSNRVQNGVSDFVGLSRTLISFYLIAEQIWREPGAQIPRQILSKDDLLSQYLGYPHLLGTRSTEEEIAFFDSVIASKVPASKGISH